MSYLVVANNSYNINYPAFDFGFEYHYSRHEEQTSTIGPRSAEVIFHIDAMVYIYCFDSGK